MKVAMVVLFVREVVRLVQFLQHRITVTKLTAIFVQNATLAVKPARMVQLF
jgi:hypothetical protein